MVNSLDLTPYYRPAQDARKLLALICCALFGSYASSEAAFVFLSVLEELTGVFPFEGTALNEFCEIFLYLSQLCVPFAIWMIVREQPFRSYLHPSRPQTDKPVNVFTVLGFTVAALAAANAFLTLLSALLAPLDLPYNAEDLVAPENGFVMALSFVSTAILPALVEEFVFRGILFGELLRFGRGFAIIASAILFASVHGSPQQILYSFVFGLILGVLTLKTGSIGPAVFLHFFNNAYAWVMELLYQRLSEDAYYLLSLTADAVITAAGLICLCVLAYRGRLDLRPDPQPADPPLPAWIKPPRSVFSALVSPVFLLYLVVSVGTALFMTFHNG